MKTTIIIISIILFSFFSVNSFASMGKLEGNTNTQYGSYSLTPSDESVVIRDVAYKTWDLTYSASGETFKVVMSPASNGDCTFTVSNGKFEVQYVKEGSNFGVRFVDQTMRTIKKKAVLEQLNQEQFNSQQLLSTKEKTYDEYLGLVACFLPLLKG